MGFIDPDIIESFASDRINLPSDVAAKPMSSPTLQPSLAPLKPRRTPTAASTASRRSPWH